MPYYHICFRQAQFKFVQLFVSNFTICTIFVRKGVLVLFFKNLHYLYYFWQKMCCLLPRCNPWFKSKKTKKRKGKTLLDNANVQPLETNRVRPPKKCHLCFFNFETNENLTNCFGCQKIVHSDCNNYKGDGDSCRG